LGSDASVLSDSIREWVRMFSWVMVYLLVMQLKDRLHPEKILSILFFSLIVPLVAAFLQFLLPPSILPSFLVFESGYSVAAGSRMNGTLGHPSTFATFVLLFFALSLWKLGDTKNNRLTWAILVGVLAFFLVSSKSLTGLVILVAFIPAFFFPKSNFVNLIGAISLITMAIFLFASSDLGHERLQSLYSTPLLNPDIDVSRAILMHWEDGNSFNWRIAQWTFLLQSWQKYPILGYGIGTVYHVSIFDTAAHNDYIRFLIEEGIIGFIAFIGFLIAQFVRLIQLIVSVTSEKSQRNFCFLMLALLISMMVGMLTDNILYHTTLLFYWWTLMAIAGWNWTPSPSEEIQLKQ
ncbi:MAG: O-antigen ligase family protein, partial [Pleurocapsa sp.]